MRRSAPRSGERPLRVVHVMTSLLSGGAEENTLATCRGQIARGYDVWLIHGNDADPATLATVPTGVRRLAEPRLRREIRLASDLAALVSLARSLRRIEPDVVHTHQSKAGVLGRLAAWRAGVPVILHSVHILPFLNVSWPKRMLYLALERLVALVTDGFISVAQGMHDANLAAGLGTRKSNHVVYSGMDLGRFRGAVPAPEAPEGQMIALVAALEPRKRHAAFLEVFAEVARDRPGLNLCLLGTGPEEAALRAQARSLGLDARVRFMGFRADVERWIAAADLCVLPSMREGLPRVVVQYVAAGKPVVVTHLEGIEEIVENGVNGFVVGRDDFEAMACAVARLLDDPELACAMSQAARAQDLSCWSVERMEPEIDGILQDILRKKAEMPAIEQSPAAIRGEARGRVGSSVPQRN